MQAAVSFNKICLSEDISPNYNNIYIYIYFYFFNRDKNRESKEEALKLVEDVKTETSGFRPFETDSDKQDRYEKFLKFVKIGAKGNYYYYCYCY
jgi:hypothetical protein